MTVALSRGMAALSRFGGGFFRHGWPSYLLLAALQLKVMWRIWDFKDLVFGDTSFYFVSALAWHDRFRVNVLWSPLYTAFYGSFLFLNGDPYVAQILHRLAIVLILTLAVLFLLRKILPPPLALLGACWWAILPINFDALYEVHLFAAIFVIAAWAAIASGDSPWNRGVGVAILGAGGILARNEYGLAAALLLIVCLIYEWRRRRRLPIGQRPNLRRYLAAYGIPLLSGAAAGAAVFWRSLLPMASLSAGLAAKHHLSMCQGFAASYRQRVPSWTLNAMTECQGLMAQVFGNPQPTLRQMIEANPKAVLEHFLWNLGLLPNGLQVLLFNGMSGQADPDFIPVNRGLYPLFLSFLVIGVVMLGGWIAARHWDSEAAAWLRARTMMFASFLPIVVIDLLVTLTMRPRPSYLLSLSVMAIVLLGSVLWFCMRRTRSLARIVRIAAPLLALALVILLPSHFQALGGGRPIHDSVERLLPQQDVLRGLPGTLLLGNYPIETMNYLGLASGNGMRDRVESSSLLDRWDSTGSLGGFLDAQGISAVYLDNGMIARLRDLPVATSFLKHPTDFGWKLAAGDTGGPEDWMLLISLRAAAASALPQ
jgi:hypothetical protein